MLRTIAAIGIGVVAGYIIGAIFGFRAAVVDYVEDDAEKLEAKAGELYDAKEGAATAMNIVEDAIEDAESSDGKGFQ